MYENIFRTHVNFAKIGSLLSKAFSLRTLSFYGLFIFIDYYIFSKEIQAQHMEFRDESGHQLKILKISALQILKIHLYSKFTLIMGLKDLYSGKTLETFISDVISLHLWEIHNGSSCTYTYVSVGECITCG